MICALDFVSGHLLPVARGCFQVGDLDGSNTYER